MRTTALSLFAIMAILITGTIPGQQLVFADGDELEVKIKIERGMSEIKVELDDDEYEFKLATSDIDEILKITSLRTGISIELLEEAMELKVKDDDDDDDKRHDDDDKRHDDDDKRHDDDDDELEDDRDSNDSGIDGMDRKLRAYTLGDSTEVKIKLEFFTTVTDSDLLIDEILDNFLVTQDEAEDFLKIQDKDDDDELEEKFKADVEMGDDFSEIEVELRYVLDSTDWDDIVSSIVEHSQLDALLLENAIDIRMDSDDDDSTADDSTADDSTADDSTADDDTELNELREENNDLRQENQALREKNNDLQQQLANLNDILMEQIRVIMDTLAALKS